MSTIVAKLIRHLSADDLRRYFAFRKIDLSTINWRAKDAPLKKSVIALINALPDTVRTIVFIDAEAIAELAGEAGHLAMLDATRHQGDVLQAFDTIDSGEGRALWLYINDPEAFRRACWVRRFDQSRDGRSWDGFIEPVGGRFDPSEPNLSALASACAEAYGKHDGFRGLVEVERFDRLPSWRDEEDAGSVTQITIYTEDRPQSRMGWEGVHLQRQIHRPASELHLTYSAANGAINVVAKGGKSMRKKIACLFARHVLGVDADPDDIEMREMDLSILADRSVLKKSVQGAIGEVELKFVRFMAIDGESPTRIYGRRKISIYDTFEPGRLELPGYEIDRVDLVFTFLPDSGHPGGKRVTATLTAPNSCSVPKKDQLYRPAIEEFLERSGIYKTSSEDDDEQTDAAA